MSAANVVLTLVYTWYIICPIFKDELKLRLAFMVASFGYIFWGLMIEDGRVVLVFNTLFVFISLRHINRIIKQRRPVVLAPEDESLRSEIFPSMSPRQFETFWKLGVPGTAMPGALLTRGELVDEVIVVLDGTAQVELDTGDRAAPAPVLLGEMSYALGQDVPASATVRLDEPVPIRTWTKSVLRDLKKNDPELEVPFLASLGQNLARKIRL